MLNNLNLIIKTISPGIYFIILIKKRNIEVRKGSKLKCQIKQWFKLVTLNPFHYDTDM